MDVFTPAKRSEVMSRIRSTGNAATELRLRALLRAEKITGWRRHVPLALPPVPSASPQARSRASASTKASARSRDGARTPSKTKTNTKTKSTAKDAVKVSGKNKASAQAKAKAKASGTGTVAEAGTSTITGTGKSPGKANAKSKAKSNAKAQPTLRGSPGARAAQGARGLRKPRVRPDFVFRAERLVIFVDGCFWHGCPTHGTRPRQNRKFWDEKIARNRQRDRLVTRQLRRQGWTVLRLWECALGKKRLPHTLARVHRALGK
ncbi:hypothetical protein [Prosthecobacter sp.]|uniref:hypothetical protein n=1 Tax=Prosthecobacter sp. TaxID=1965333 RepID=UPI00378507CB